MYLLGWDFAFINTGSWHVQTLQAKRLKKETTISRWKLWYPVEIFTWMLAEKRPSSLV